MEIKSKVFKNNGEIPSKYTCDGENINPPITISGIPKEAKSLVLIVEDPDAAGGKIFDHWVIWNIPPELGEIEEGKVPNDIMVKQGTNDFGEIGYGGPCPPPGHGKHRYVFKAFALDTMLDLTDGYKKEDVVSMMNGRLLAEAFLTGVYGR